MSQNDIIEAKKVWDKVKKVIENGDIVREVIGRIRYTNFPSKNFNEIAHIRPHAQNAADTLPLPILDKVTRQLEYTKQSFWLNNSYIRDVIYPD